MTSVYSHNRQTKQLTRVNGGMTNVYSHNADGQLLSVSIPGEGTVSYQYDASGLNTEIILPGGIRRIQSYDALGRLSAVQVKDSLNNDVLTQSYQRSLTGSLQTKTTGSGVWNYCYDLTDQLTSEQLTNQQSTIYNQQFSYDAMGNRVQVSGNRGQESEITDYAANSLNQYLSISNSMLSAPCALLYDANGNLTNDSVRAYTWDLRNQLVRVHPLICTNGSLMAEFAYDYMGRRIRKDVYSYSAQSQWSKAQSLSYFYDGWNLVSEIRSQASGVSTNIYIWGNDLSGAAQGVGGVGGLLAIIQGGAGSPGTPYYPLYDHNGNIEKYISSSGAVVAEYQYDAFGNTIQESVVSGLQPADFSMRFSTKYFDAETGLAYYGYRYYSPEKGRWISRDPMGEDASRNLYRCVGNNMINHVDVLGLWGDDVHLWATFGWASTSFKRTYAGVIAGADQGIDDNSETGPTRETGIARHLRRVKKYGEDSRNWFYKDEYRQAIDALAEAGKALAAGKDGREQAQQSCKKAAQAFGRGLHSWQDISAHRQPWPFGDREWPLIYMTYIAVHPGWWDYYGDIYTVSPDSSELRWNKWGLDRLWDEQGGRLTNSDYFSWKGLRSQRDSQAWAQVMVRRDSERALWSFANDVQANGCCADELLRDSQ